MGQCAAGLKGPIPKTPKKGFKVCVCGASGGIGMPLSMLMALDPRVWELAVYDLTIALVPAEGVGADLSHIERKCNVKAYSLETTQKPVEHLEECLKGCNLVLVPAGVPSKGRNKNDLLKINFNIAKSIVEACAKFCPAAIVGLIINPLNSIVPAMAKLYEKAGLEPQKICGITTLDVVRSNKFLHDLTGQQIESMSVPVVGGYTGVQSGPSAVPLFSQCPSAAKLDEDQLKKLIESVQEANKAVTDAKKGKGAAVLSMAYAGARFGQAVLAGLSGVRTTECCFVKSDVQEGLDYFASKVTFGPDGVEQVHPVGKITPFEATLLNDAVKILKQEIDDGLKYANESKLGGQSDTSNESPAKVVA